MDCRQNTVRAESFYQILADFMRAHKPVNLIIDREGIERVSGTIKDISPHDKVLRARVTMQDETGFNIQQVIAVNGIFRDDFAEC